MGGPFLTVTSHGRQSKGTFSSCLYKGMNPINKGRDLLPKVPSSNNVTLDDRISAYEIEGYSVHGRR